MKQISEPKVVPEQARGRQGKGAIALTVLVGVWAGGALADSVSGVVLDEQGAGLGGATVYAEQEASKIITSGFTNEQGEFLIPLRTSGAHRVYSSKKGFKSEGAESLTVDGSGVEGIELAMTSMPIVPGIQLSTADIVPNLPNLHTPAGQRVSRSCAQCHSISALFWRGGRAEVDWAATVARMGKVVGGYFPISEQYQDEYVAYLTEHLGPDSQLPEHLGTLAKNAELPIPIGNDVIYTEYEIPSALALAHTAVPDQRGSVWFASFGAGNVGRLNIEEGTVTEYTPSTPDVHPHGITVGPDGIVWYSAMPYGIGRIDPDSGEMAEFKMPDPTESSRGTPHTIIVARDGMVWFTELANGSISRFDPETEEFTRFPIESRSGPYAILEHPEEDNVFWFGLSGASKIGTFDVNTGQIKSFPTPTARANPQRIRFDSKKRIWFGEYSGDKIGMFDPETEEMVEYDLPAEGSAYCIHVDEDDKVWVASTYRESLIRFDPESEEMTEYPLPGAGADGDMLGGIVRDIWPDETGRMWFVEWSRNKVSSAEFIPDQ